MKEAIEAVCGLKLINLTVNTIKILSAHFFYNTRFLIIKNFK